VSRRARRGEGGFTLIELMIGSLIASLTVGAALAAGTMLAHSYGDQRRTVQIQRSARASLEIIGEAIRNVSPGVPSGNVYDLVGCSTFGAILVTNGNQAPDRLDVIYGSGGIVTSLRDVYLSTSTSLTVLDGSQFRVGDQAVVSDLTQGHIVTITSVSQSGGNWILGTAAPATRCPNLPFPTLGYTAGALLVRAHVASFYVDSSAAVSGIPTLMMDPDGYGPAAAQPLADGIEDLQLAVGVDINGDGAVTDAGSTTDEWFYNVVGDAAPPANGTTTWRAVRVSLVALNPEEPLALASYTRPRLEDHNAATAADQYRRRVLTTTVEIRNLQGSP
jgi:hypothetical protein